MADTTFWPGDARLAITISMMFEANGQPISGAGGPITEPIKPGYPDLATNTYFDYGMREGIPRLLDLFDRRRIRVSSFMIGQAVEKNPRLAREIAERGHEVAAHGRTWEPQYALSREEERAFIQDSVESIERATGQKPVGYNCYWIRDSVNTLELLQELGFVYHIDDLSHDEPFIQRINGQPFVTVPYTVHLNDIVSFDFPNYAPLEHLQVLKDEFDQLYAEGAHRRRMMVVGTHDRISGRPNRIRVLEEFITYAQAHPGIWFATKTEIAHWALQTPEITPLVEREKPEISGMPAGHISVKV